MPLAAERYISDGSTFLFETGLAEAKDSHRHKSIYIGTAESFRFNPPGRRLYEGAKHAPKGGISIAGHDFKGGEFIPGEVLAKATPAEKEKLNQKQRSAKAGGPRASYFVHSSDDAPSKDLSDKIKSEGGFTYQPSMHGSPTAGFSVSLETKHERSFAPHEVTPEVVKKYIDDRKDVFAMDPTASVGGWYDTEKNLVYLDISHVVKDQSEAEKLGKQHNQEGIFDLANKKTIIIKSAEQRRSEATGTPPVPKASYARADSGGDSGTSEKARSPAEKGNLAHRALSAISKFVHGGGAGKKALADFEKAASAHDANAADIPPDERQSKLDAFKKDYHSKRIMAKLGTYIDESAENHLSKGRKEAYLAAAQKVLGGMSPTAVERMNYHLNDGEFFDDTKALTNEMRKHYKDISSSSTIGGVYQSGKLEDGSAIMKLILDGGTELGIKANEVKGLLETASLYAHEFGHAIDGPNFELSSSKEWKAAWDKEICDKYPATGYKSGKIPLTEYAQTEQSEGFAEFARLVHEDRSKAAKLFPQCWGLWKGWKLS